MQNIQIPPFDTQSAAKAQKILDNAAKLPGSLGLMEKLIVQLAGIQGKERPSFSKKAHILFSGDHEIALHGLSTAGQSMTTMQTINFAQGGGCINAFCRTAGADLTVVDVGMKDDVHVEGLVKKNVMRAVRDFSQGPAMSKAEALACIQVGIDQAREKAAAGYTLLGVGEMGIGNTSPSSAIVAVVTGSAVHEVTSVGSGIDNAAMLRKINLIFKGIQINKPNPNDGLDILAKVGGAEIAAMTGLMLGGASLRIPVVLDGFIAGAAAAIAIKLQPECQKMLIASHISQEIGHGVLLKNLNLQTYLDLNLRLGEGTGAVLMFPLIDSAVRILHEVITFEQLLAIS